MLRINVNEVLHRSESQRQKEKPPVQIRVIGRAYQTKAVAKVIVESDADVVNESAKHVPPASAQIPSQKAGALNIKIEELNEQMGSIKRERGKLSSSIFELVYGHREAPTIDIGSVLNHFDNTVDEATNEVLEYEIQFLALNRDTGNVYVREMRARKNVNSPKRQVKEKNPRGKQMYNLKFAGTIMLRDTKHDLTRSVKVRMIFAFRKPGETTWCRVADRAGGFSGKLGPTEQVYDQNRLNELYHEIDEFQPRLQTIFRNIRSLEETGQLPAQIQPTAAAELAALKVERGRLNDLIYKTNKKLQPSAKPLKDAKRLDLDLKLAEAIARRDEVLTQIDKLK